MKYLQKSFTVPACTRRMTDEEYAIAVGARRPARKKNPPAQRKKGKEQ